MIEPYVGQGSAGFGPAESGPNETRRGAKSKGLLALSSGVGFSRTWVA
jgi:hypothetical protein